MSMIRIGNASGFWGDRPDAAKDLLAADPELDFITLDYLAELSLSILAIQKEKDPKMGFAKDFLEVVETLLPYWKKGGKCRLVTNAGGLNPRSCGQAVKALLEKEGLHKKVGIVFGDDVKNKKFIAANAYLGGGEIAKALQKDAEIVITGRVTDPSLTVGPCLYHFGWESDAYTKIAGATMAGHLIECGTQVTGGISTNWLQVPNVVRMGFPIVEVEDSGECILTKQKGSGGWVTLETVKEQLLYEIGDPGAYLSPDVTVSLLEACVIELGKDRVQLKGVLGAPPPSTYKVSACYAAGYQAEGIVGLFGEDTEKKALKAADMILERIRFRGFSLQKTKTEIFGSKECILRVAVFDPDRGGVEAFSKEWASLVTSGPQGISGYARGRPAVRPVFGYSPFLIEKSEVVPQVEIL